MTTSISAANIQPPSSGLAQASAPKDFQANFAGLHGGGAALSAQDRILPNPARSRSYLSGSGSGSTSIDGLSCNARGYRSVNTWATTDSFSSSSQASNRTASTTLSSSQETNGRTPASPTSQEMGLGFIPISHTPQPNSGSTTGAVPMEPAEVSPEYLPSLKIRCRTLSRENLSAAEGHGAEGYTHYGDEIIGRRSTAASISSGHLSNGEAYTPIRPAMEGRVTAFSDNRYPSSDYSHHFVRRTSIAALNNASGY